MKILNKSGKIVELKCDNDSHPIPIFGCGGKLNSNAAILYSLDEIKSLLNKLILLLENDNQNRTSKNMS